MSFCHIVNTGHYSWPIQTIYLIERYHRNDYRAAPPLPTDWSENVARKGPYRAMLPIRKLATVNEITMLRGCNLNRAWLPPPRLAHEWRRHFGHPQFVPRFRRISKRVLTLSQPSFRMTACRIDIAAPSLCQIHEGIWSLVGRFVTKRNFLSQRQHSSTRIFISFWLTRDWEFVFFFKISLDSILLGEFYLDILLFNAELKFGFL